MAVNDAMDVGADLGYYPPLVWGLDHQFNVYNKMYIKDVVDMPPYPTSPGAFAYKNHPIFKVDVIGVVVKVDQNSKCFVYAVDDGTGVILCCCWKEGFHKYRLSDLAGLPPVLLKKVTEIVDDAETITQGYCLGDLIKVRGKIKIFRDKKEIVANHHCKICDPMVAVWRMCELRKLYADCYDKPFQPPPKVQQTLYGTQPGDGDQSANDRATLELKSVLLTHFTRTEVVEVTVNELLQMDKVKLVVKEFCQNQLESSEVSLCLVLRTMAMLEDEGLVVKRCDRRMLYEILLHDSKLEATIKQILMTEVQKPKYAALGCHCMHILDQLHKTLPYAKLKKPCLVYCLHKLESESVILTTTKAHYLPCDYG